MGGLPPLTGKWRGPARVLKRLGPVSFEIQDVATEVQMKAHLNHLKRYCPPNELSYAAEDDEDDDDGDDGDEGDVGADEPPNSVDPWVAVLTSMMSPLTTPTQGMGGLWNVPFTKRGRGTPVVTPHTHLFHLRVIPVVHPHPVWERESPGDTNNPASSADTYQCLVTSPTISQPKQPKTRKYRYSPAL
ncbi:uncharacterized protein LOC119571066 [Penaeus monodon]|uniref:uncharacterized protein LOC119571066 n=1 Tax=Penaeus monodon TaxID=6687 RepID=UPI0018A78AD8|nr:uncharacterized protein LOC119571066 [Penaeus monodon]